MQQDLDSLEVRHEAEIMIHRIQSHLLPPGLDPMIEEESDQTGPSAGLTWSDASAPKQNT